MARSIERLTDRTLRSLASPVALPGLYADGGNLFLQIASSAARSWVYRWRDAGRQRDCGLGSLRDVSLKQAREKRDATRAMIRNGLDPIAEARKLRRKPEAASALPTFGNVLDAYIEAHKASWKNKKHLWQWESTRTYAATLIALHVADIETEHVTAVLNPIWKTKTETATRVRQRIEAVLDFATVRELRKGPNPARWKGHLETLLAAPTKIKKVVRQPALAIHMVEEFIGKLRLRPSITARMLEMVVLTACRVSEVAGAKWSEIDLDNQRWTIPAERMKANAEHRVPLTPRLVEILEGLNRRTEFVFPGLKQKTHLNPEGARKLLQTDMGYSDVTTHGFRSTFRDWCSEIAHADPEVSEMSLAHTIKNAIEAAYRRGDLFIRRRELMQRWEAFCGGAK